MKFKRFSTFSLANGMKASTFAGNSNVLKDEEYDEDEDENGQDDQFYDENQHQNHEYLPNQQHHHGQQRYHQQQQQQRSYSNGNGANQGFQHYSRLRRGVLDFNDLELNNKLACNRSRCAVIRCRTTQPMYSGSSAFIAVRMRVVTQTLNLVCSKAYINFTFPISS